MNIEVFAVLSILFACAPPPQAAGHTQSIFIFGKKRRRI
jgi:hypothetical protein